MAKTETELTNFRIHRLTQEQYDDLSDANELEANSLYLVDDAKEYVEKQADGSINVGGKKITNLATPTANGDAVPKSYVDTIANARNIKTYTALTQIGLTVGSETIEAIASALPQNSELITVTGGNNNAEIYPATKYGTLRVTKGDEGRINFQYTPKSTNTIYTGVYTNDSTVTQKWTGWDRVVTATDLDNAGGIPIATTAGVGSAYTATVDGITSLTKGAMIVIIPHTVSTSKTVTLNVNSLGAKQIRQKTTYRSDTDIQPAFTSWLASNEPVLLMYDGTYWIQMLGRANAVDIVDKVPISSGGTDATTAKKACENLNAVSYEDKKSGTYTGGNTGTSLTQSGVGKGKGVLIYNTDCMAILSNGGAIYADSSGISFIPAADCRTYENSNGLAFVVTGSKLYAPDVEYHYQVL